MQAYLTFISGGICATLMIFSIIDKSLSNRRKYSLFFISACTLLLLISDWLFKMYNGNAKDIYSYIGRIAKFSVYFQFLLIILSFNFYLKDLFANEGKTKDIPLLVKYVDYIIAIGIITLGVSQFTGLYYTYENNVYQRADGFIIAYVFPILSLMFQMCAILTFKDKIRKRMVIPIFLFTAMPLVAAVAQFFLHKVSLTSITIVAMVILLYCFSIEDTNNMLAEAHKKEVAFLIDKQENIRKMTMQTALALVEAIDAKDEYTKGHSSRVADYSVMLAEKAGKSKEEQQNIYFIALLHDVGKIGVPDTIINKKGKLNDEELELMNRHPLIGEEILSKITSSPDLVIGAAYHHERIDGKGYPYGLSGDEIPEIAKLVAVADAYDSMASKRSYRDVMPQSAIREQIENGIGTQFDPTYAKYMLELIDNDSNYDLKQS